MSTRTNIFNCPKCLRTYHESLRSECASQCKHCNNVGNAAVSSQECPKCQVWYRLSYDYSKPKCPDCINDEFACKGCNFKYPGKHMSDDYTDKCKWCATGFPPSFKCKACHNLFGKHQEHPTLYDCCNKEVCIKTFVDFVYKEAREKEKEKPLKPKAKQFNCARCGHQYDASNGLTVCKACTPTAVCCFLCHDILVKDNWMGIQGKCVCNNCVQKDKEKCYTMVNKQEQVFDPIKHLTAMPPNAKLSDLPPSATARLALKIKLDWKIICMMLDIHSTLDVDDLCMNDKDGAATTYNLVRALKFLEVATKRGITVGQLLAVLKELNIK